LDRFFHEYFSFSLPVSFHRCSITRKNEKKIIIFIIGLYNKLHASVASAAGPFTKKKVKKNSARMAAVSQRLIQWHTARMLDVFHRLEARFIN
jgi:hypothetical protein